MENYASPCADLASYLKYMWLYWNYLALNIQKSTEKNVKKLQILVNCKKIFNT